MPPLPDLFRLIVRTLAAQDASRVHQPLSLNELMDAVVPYRLARRELGVDTSEDYESLFLRLVAGATHPFADWREQDIYPDERYRQVVEDMQIVARANLIFGLHVHVGIEDRETLIHLMNQVRYFLPHLLALSTNSPFWIGMNTGFKSYRCKVFDRFPRTNIPDEFSSWADFENFVNLLVRTKCIDNAKKIWWDIRPHPFFGTLEFRICDIPMRVDETIALAGLIQATVAKLYRLHSRNQSWRQYGRALLMENKWRALRYGLDSATPNRTSRSADGPVPGERGAAVFSVPVRQPTRPGIDATLELRIRPWNVEGAAR